MPSYVLILVAIAVIVLPILIGAWLARIWRMPDHGWRIGLVLFTVFAGAAITYFGWPPKLGIDLSGGTKLIYDVSPNKARGEESFDMDKLISAVTRRVNPQGISEVSIRPYGPDEIEIIIPEADNREDARRIEEKISSAGTLEFRILADRRDPGDDRAIELALRDPSAVEVRAANGDLLAEWVPMSEKAVPQFVNRPNLVTRQNERGQWEILVIIDPYNVNGDYLSVVRPGVDEYGRPAVHFSFNQRGARLFGRLTSENLPDPTNPDFMRHLGIILDGVLDSAPTIRSTITDNGQIEGDFTEVEVRDLVDVLRAGQLPAKLSERPVSSQIIDATLGPDTIRKGAISMAASVAVVMVFMLVYYRFSGVVACMALVLNVLLTLAVMITLKAAFTLPGLAGLVLTVGMAVDANVLIYERMREELARGAALRMAIRNGFSRAMTTIIDSNVTTILTAVVLYIIGSAEVKGFAITLFIGLALSMYTATFCARVVFDVAERRGWIKDLKMMRLIGATNIDFLRLAWPAITASLVVIAIGMVAVFARGSNLLNIDFTGGTQITMLFQQPQRIADVRRIVDQNRDALPDASVNYVSFEDEPRGLRIEINTSQQDQELVQKRLEELFGKDLVRQQLSFADVKPIPADSTAEPAAVPTKPEPAQSSHSNPLNPQRSLAGEMAKYWRSRVAENKSASAVDSELLLAQAEAAKTATASSESENKASAQPATTTSEPATTTTTAPQTPAESPATDKQAPTPEKAATSQPAQEQSSPPSAGEAIKQPAPATPSVARENVFAGGTSARLTFYDPMDYDTVRAGLERQFAGTPEAGLRFELYNLDAERRSAGRAKHWELKIAPARGDQRATQPQRLEQSLRAYQQKLSQEPYFPSVTSFGGKVAASTQEQAIYALLASLLLIVAYIWIRFQKVIFGLAAVVALIHDVLVTLGALALSAYLAPYLGFLLIDPFKIDLPIVAAFLTLIGFSLNDTIVIFDRIREIRGKSPDLTAATINLSVNQTLSRTILTSLTVFMTVFILYVWGGQGIHGFAFALFVGVIAGTYSTVYIASPVLLWLFNWQRKRSLAPSASGGMRRQPTPAR
jgi:SecD/SecF fusion protein